MYHNTTNETPEDEKTFTRINKGQDTKVLEVCRGLDKPFSASLIWKQFGGKDYFMNPAPLTSIRRSINTLKNAGYIIETGEKVKGIYGRNEFEYKLNN